MKYTDKILPPVLAILAGVVGAYLFSLMLRRGFYAIVLIGAATGAGGGALVRPKDWVNAVVCTVIAICCSYLAEWYYMPFVKDDRLLFFIQHIGYLSSIKHILIAAGSVICFYMALGLRKKQKATETQSEIGS